MKKLFALVGIFVLSSAANAGVGGKYLCTQPKDEIYGNEARASYELTDSFQVISIKFWEQDAKTGILVKNWFDESSGTFEELEDGYRVSFMKGENFEHFVSIAVTKSDGSASLDFARDGRFSGHSYNLICAKQ